MCSRCGEVDALTIIMQKTPTEISENLAKEQAHEQFVYAGSPGYLEVCLCDRRTLWLQDVHASTYGMQITLAGSSVNLTEELSQAEFVYIRSPGYNGADTIQVCSLSMPWIGRSCARTLA